MVKEIKTYHRFQKNDKYMIVTADGEVVFKCRSKLTANQMLWEMKSLGPGCGEKLHIENIVTTE